MTKILVTGASGFVGSHVLPVLLADGHTVRALVRGDRGRGRVLARLTSHEQASVTFALGDVTDPETLRDALAGADAIVHLVALPRDWNGGRDLERVNLGGTRNVLDAAAAAGLTRLIHLGAMGVVNDARLHYAGSKARAEEAVSRSGLRWTILKPSLLWGERDGFFNILASLVRYAPGVVPVLARQRSKYQPLWVGDLANAVQICLRDEATAGRAIELGGPDVWTYRQMLEEVIRGMGRRRLLVPVPVPLVKGVARAAEFVRVPFPVASDQLRQLAYDNAAALDGVRRAFGFDPRPMAGNLGYLRKRSRDQEPLPPP
jgi:NADH dehydrogenase